MFNNKGSSEIKAGFSTSMNPNILIKPEVGLNKYYNIIDNKLDEQEILCPTENEKITLKCYNIIENGIIKDFNLLTKIFEKIISLLSIKIMDFSVLITVHPFTTKNQKIILSEILFEKFSIGSIFFADQGILNLYSLGLRNGISLESGSDITFITPVIDYQVVRSGVEKINIGGKDVTKNFQVNLKKEGYYLNNFDYINRMKEIACNSNIDNKFSINNTNFILPDGSEINLSNTIQNSGNIMFRPSDLTDFKGITSLITESIINCDLEIRPLFNNIIISGGNTLLKYFPEVLDYDLKNKLKNNFQIHSKENRRYQNWTGGCILSNLNSFNNLWITREEFINDNEKTLLDMKKL